jgi:pimeloyl-ACP methyl ester carboxylesterase
MISRRQAFAPIAAAVAVPPLQADAHKVEARTPTQPLPERYDEPLGIGLEGWPYPAPLRWQQCMVGGQTLRMAYMDVSPTGQANKKTVVLLHGKNFDSSYWAGPIKYLTDAGFRVIVPDQIGFNKSSKPDITYSLDMLADLTINLLGGLQIDQSILIGHSTGGMLAVRIAAAYPKRVERLILEDPIGLVDYRRYVPPQSIETLIAAERRRTVSSYRAFVRNYFPILPAAAMEPFVEWRMRVAHSGEYDRFCKAAALTYQMIYLEPVRDQYDDIPAPTLMIVGEKDKAAPLINYAPPDMAAKMPLIPRAAADAIKDMRDGRLFIVPGAGHVPHLEAPDVVRDQILGFLKI